MLVEVVVEDGDQVEEEVVMMMSVQVIDLEGGKVILEEMVLQGVGLMVQGIGMMTVQEGIWDLEIWDHEIWDHVIWDREIWDREIWDHEIWVLEEEEIWVQEIREDSIEEEMTEILTEVRRENKDGLMIEEIQGTYKKFKKIAKKCFKKSLLLFIFCDADHAHQIALNVIF